MGRVKRKNTRKFFGTHYARSSKKKEKISLRVNCVELNENNIKKFSDLIVRNRPPQIKKSRIGEKDENIHL